jgi:hypothetical protein
MNASARGFKMAGFGADPFKSGSFTSATGNVYEHQGSAQTDTDKAISGVLIDQQPESPTPKAPKSE